MVKEKNTLDFNITNAVRAQTEPKLNSLLNMIKKDNLSIIASNHNIPGRSKMRKQELIDNLFQYLCNDQSVKNLLLILKPIEWNFFMELIEESFLHVPKFEYQRDSNLLSWGIVYQLKIHDRLYYVLPDEIKKAYYKLIEEGLLESREIFQTTYKYLCASSNLYGAIEIENLLKIINSQNDFKIDENNLIDIYCIFSEINQPFYISKDYIISDYFEDDGLDELRILLSGTRTKAYYVPDKDDFLKYSDDLYYEMTQQLIALKRFILKEFSKDESKVNDFIDEFQLLCSMDEPMQDIMDVFTHFDISFDNKEQYFRLIPLIIDVKNNTRIWANHGYTPIELSRLSGRPNIENMGNIISINDHKVNNPVKSKKIGRNEPCPCGSGKKYKKCCGR